MVSFRSIHFQRPVLQPVDHPLQPGHVLNASRHPLPIYSVCSHLSLSSLLHFCLRLPAQISGPYSFHEVPPS